MKILYKHWGIANIYDKKMILNVAENIINELTSNINSGADVAHTMSFLDYWLYNNPKQAVVNSSSIFASCFELDTTDFLNRLDKSKKYMWKIGKRFVAYSDGDVMYVLKGIKLNDLSNTKSYHGNNIFMDFERNIKYVDNIIEIVKNTDKPSKSALMTGKPISRKEIRGVLFKAFVNRDETMGYTEVVIKSSGFITCAYSTRDDDESVFTSVCCDYQGYGLGQWAASLVRKLFKSVSGAQSESGFIMLQKIWIDSVKKALSSGYYDNALKTNQMTKNQLNQIIQWFKAIKRFGYGFDTFKQIKAQIQ